MWAKISTSATAMACAACIATAATLPVMGEAADQLAQKFSSAEVNLAVDFSRLAAFDAIPAYIALLGGDLTALDDLDSLSAINPYIALAGGDLTALDDLDSVSAINPYIALAGGDITATGDLDSLSAVDTFFGDGPVGADGVTPVGGVFTGGGIDALAPNADSGGGYAALSALPVFFGSNAPNTNFGPGVFNPQANGTGGLAALSNYDALSAIPAYLDLPPNDAPELTLRTAAPEQQTEEPSSGLVGTGNPVLSAVQKVQIQPQVEELKPPVTTPDNTGGPKLNISRLSEKFTPESIGKSPILFPTGTPGVDNSIRGWGEGLKKLGIGGADAPSADGAE